MSQNRLLVLGFDSMDVGLVRRWAAAGYLPTFRGLFESAAWSEYMDPPGLTSATVWPCVNTGVGSLRHDFLPIRICGGSYWMRVGRADDVKVDPFWAWFAQAGRRIVLGDVPIMVSRPEYGGKQFWGWGVHDWWWRETSVPRGLLRSLSARYGSHPVPQCHDYSTETDSLLRLRSGLLTGIERRTAILKSLIASHDWDFFYAVYSEPHCAGHLMWHLEDDSHPRHSAEQLATVGHALRDVYAGLDRALADLLACAEPNTTLAVFLPYGMGPNYQGTHLLPELLDRFNHRWGREGSETKRGNSHDGRFDVLWKASVGRLPAALRFRVKELLPMSLRMRLGLRRQQSPRRWSRMPAFLLPSEGYSSLRINLAGREPQGIIQNGEEHRQYLDAFTVELSQLTNGDTGEPVVERIFRADQQADPVTIGSGMDLIVWWNKSRPIRAV